MVDSPSGRAAAAALTIVLALPAGASAASSGPSRAQIRAAVASAERSSNLWATVNVCNIPSAHPKGTRLIGVRVQMPALGFTARLYVGVRVEYWSNADQRFERTTASFGPKSIGRATHGVHQSGVVFHFQTPAAGDRYVLRGVADLEWRLNNKVIGQVVRNTGHGYRNVDYSDPPGYNAGTCTLTR